MAPPRIANDAPAPLSPLFNITYTPNRLSPLYNFPSIPHTTSSPALKAHARALQNVLRGDVLRGVRVVVDPDATATDQTFPRAGAMKAVRWETLPAVSPSPNNEEGAENDDREEGAEKEPEEEEERRGVSITLEFEFQTYHALLLPSGTTEDTEEFTHLPLLLFRMPAALKKTVVDYLQQNFDCQVTSFSVPEPLLRSQLGLFIAEHRNRRIERETVVHLAPIAKKVGKKVKGVTLSLDKNHVGKIAKQGRKEGKDLKTEEWFWKGLERWAEGMLGLKMGELELVKVQCDGFVLQSGESGRIKVFKQGGMEPWRGLCRVIEEMQIA